MPTTTTGRAARRALALAGGVLFIGACAGVLAPAPPASPPTLAQEAIVAGHPITIAARAARTLYNDNFATRRFGSDSTWGYRASDKLAVRMRYAMPSADSTRVLIELWSPCQPAPRCAAGDMQLLIQQLGTEEGPPM